MEIKDILLTFQKSIKIKENSISGRKFAESVGIASAQYNKYVTGKSKPTVEVLERIRKVYPAFVYGAPLTLNEPAAEYQTKAKNLPVYDLFLPSAKGDHTYDLKTAQVIDYFAIPIFRDALGYILIKDDSMVPLLNNGDYAAILHTQKSDVVYGEKYLVIFKDKSRRPLNRFIRRGSLDTYWVLKPSNLNYDDLEVNIDEVRDIYLIKGGVVSR